MEKKAASEGLRWIRGRPVWRATRAAIKAGYPVKSVNLSSLANDERLLIGRAQRLQAEMRQWLNGINKSEPYYDGTISSLLNVYQLDSESPYNALKPSSRHPYDVYIRMLIMEVGSRQVTAVDGRDIRRWFTAWSQPDREGGKRKIAAARMAITVLKTALKFGKACRMRGCADLKSILEDMEFEGLKPRTSAPTAAQVIAARAAAHKLGHPLAALAYALQFEATLRQWDVIGEWVPLDDKRASAVLDGKQKWIGPTWSMIDHALVLRATPTKTEQTSAASIEVDLSECPMVVEELSKIPVESRLGPLIVNPNTGLPYRQWYFRDLWRKCARLSGIPDTVWNRDLRAGGNTEGQRAGAPLDDRKKLMGHTAVSRVTAEVYDRDKLEAARRVSRARVAHRSKNET
jgi:hypothetical protein